MIFAVMQLVEVDDLVLGCISRSSLLFVVACTE